MNRYLKLAFLLLMVGGVGFVGGFFVGAKDGVLQFFLLDSSAKASLLTYELQSLRAGNAKTIIEAKEIQLDGEVVRFAAYRREGRPWVFFLENWEERDHNKYMKRVAAYRKQYPPFIPTVDFGTNNPMKEDKDEMEKYAQEVKDVTAEILKEYGK
jgi:hypothetical protein